MPRFREVLDENPYRQAEEFTLENITCEVAGSAVSRAFWQEIDTGERWFAKSEVLQTDKHAKKEALLEYLANRIYAYYGIPVTRLAIAHLHCQYTTEDNKIIYENELRRIAAHIF